MQKFRADARFGGVVNPVYVRVAHHDGKIFIDRATPDGSAYEVSKAGLVINPKPPVRFSRPDGMLPMIEADLAATPMEGLEAFESITRFKEERDLVLTVSSMLDMLGGRGAASGHRGHRAAGRSENHVRDGPGETHRS